MDVVFSISDVQVDNQLHFRGSYDFPVVLIGQEVSPIQHLHSLNIPMNRLIKNARAKALITIECNFEIWNDTVQEVIVTGQYFIKLFLSFMCLKLLLTTYVSPQF